MFEIVTLDSQHLPRNPRARSGGATQSVRPETDIVYYKLHRENRRAVERTPLAHLALADVSGADVMVISQRHFKDGATQAGELYSSGE